MESTATGPTNTNVRLRLSRTGEIWISGFASDVGRSHQVLQTTNTWIRGRWTNEPLPNLWG